MDHISFLIFCPEVAPRRDEGVMAMTSRAETYVSNGSQSRHSDHAPLTSGFPRLADILGVIRHLMNRRQPTPSTSHSSVVGKTRQGRTRRHRRERRDNCVTIA